MDSNIMLYLKILIIYTSMSIIIRLFILEISIHQMIKCEKYENVHKNINIGLTCQLLPYECGLWELLQYIYIYTHFKF